MREKTAKKIEAGSIFALLLDYFYTKSVDSEQGGAQRACEYNYYQSRDLKL